MVSTGVFHGGDLPSGRGVRFLPRLALRLLCTFPPQPWTWADFYPRLQVVPAPPRFLKPVITKSTP